jgi:glucosamine--fructose-6-phosphate aminotransferase (isomerizing)
VRTVLSREDEIARLAGRYCSFRNFMFIGRGINYPIALEGALKLKEVSYIHAEGTSAGALKHGPIALLDQDFPVIAICTDSTTKDKVAGNVHEVAARGAPVVALVTEGDHSLDRVVTDRIEIPAGDEAAAAILSTVVLQLFAYHMAVLLGRDVDQPRNLAKSVTVE